MHGAAEGLTLNEIVSTFVVPIVLMLMSVGIAAIGWFLQVLHRDVAKLSAKVGSLHETYATRKEFEQLRKEFVDLSVELHKSFVSRQDHMAGIVQTQMLLDSLRKEMNAVHASLNAVSAALEGRPQLITAGTRD